MKKVALVAGIIAIVLIVLFFVYGFGFDVGDKFGTRIATQNEQFFHERDNEAYYTAKYSDSFVLSDNKVVEKFGDYSRVLFENLKDVTAVRLGPEGKTLHFLSKKPNDSLCVDLKTKRDPLTQSDEAYYRRLKVSFPKLLPPWNFNGYVKKDGDLNFLPPMCDSGYKELSGRAVFVYLETPTSLVQARGALVIEDGDKKSVIPLTGDDIEGLGSLSKGDVAFDYPVAHFRGGESGDLYYPSQVFELPNKRTVAQFGGKLLVVEEGRTFIRNTVNLPKLGKDLVNGRGCGINVEHGASNVLTVFVNQCEGRTLSMLIDLSGNNPKPVDLSVYGLGESIHNKIVRTETQNLIAFDVTKAKYLDEELGIDYGECGSHSNLELNDKYRQKAMQKYPGKDIKCDLCANMGSGCYLYTKEIYQYTTGKGFEKID